MNFPVTDRRHRSEHHVETIEPRPALDVVEAYCPGDDEKRQGANDDAKIAQAAHGSRVILKQKPFAAAKGFKIEWPSDGLCKCHLREVAARASNRPSANGCDDGCRRNKPPIRWPAR